MDNNLIKNATLEVFQKFNIKSFPIDCEAILNAYGMKIKTYSSQKPKKKERCLFYSDEAYTLKGTVYYNDSKPIGRIHFSLAHEIAHIALKHGTPSTKEQEKEADAFASYFLAPRMTIHYAHCKNHIQVAKLFGVSLEAAQYAFDDYRKWHRRAVYKMDSFDKAMYSHFYNDKINGFAYSIKKCKFCGKILINNNLDKCSDCTIRISPRFESYGDENFRRAESYWLYGGL